LIIGDVHPSPFPFCDVAMTTTHKTLRGPRGAIILCKEQHAKKIDSAVFPGNQGGPHDNVTAAKAVAFKEAFSEDFKLYAKNVVENAHILAGVLNDGGIKLVTGGTDNHLILINLLPFGVGLGKEVAIGLENAGIVANCNTVPFDPSTAFRPSGLRIGTPAITTRGMKQADMERIGIWIASIIKDYRNVELQKKIRKEVKNLCREYPV
jgi:glycine hydroxymethyltransferase